MKSLLFWLHRWAGVVLSAFMLVWFVSGLVILYSDNLTPTRPGQLAHAETLNPEAGWLSLGEAWDASTAERKSATALDTLKPDSPTAAAGVIVDARLVRLAGQPYWVIETGSGKRFALSALDGKLHRITVEEALRIALHWMDGEAPVQTARVRYQQTLETDSTLTNLESWKPFHRVTVEDDAATELLISARTGEVIRASTGFERGLYYLGNWIHLMRFVEAVRPGGDTRHILQMWLGFGFTLASATGLIAGWMRWRPGWFCRPTYSRGRTHPYRDVGWKWHFLTGLMGGVFAFSWSISGYLSTNPWQIFSNANPSRAELAAWYGPAMPAVLRDWKPGSPLLPGQGRLVELNWRHLGDEALLLAVTAEGQRIRQPVEGTVQEFGEPLLMVAAARLSGQSSVGAMSSRLFRHDDYYYPRRSRSSWDRPLPVVQIDFPDAVGSRLYLDPVDGRVIVKQDQSRRVYRWVYSLLHYWDFGRLQIRPFWDAWMLTWIGLGLVMSGTSVALAWNRLRRSLARQARRHRDQSAVTTETMPVSSLAEPSGH
jgi:uncharacterized iron-regulated membrane protein